MIGVLVSGLAVLGYISTAAASPLATAAQVSPRDFAVQVDFKCRKVDGKLVCGSTKGNKNRDDDDDDNEGDDEPKKSKDKAIPKTCGKKVNCEPGFVRLEKPNKYGACCEAREGLPPPTQQEAEKCKFPGEVGTPPNCSCPNGTEFLGYKGCVAYTYQEAYCINPSTPGGGFNTKASEDLAKKCKSEGGYGQCKTKESCCCMKKVFAK